MHSLFAPADDAALTALLSSEDPNEVARTHLRLSRRHEARAVVLSHRIGESVYNEMLHSQQQTGRMSLRKAAEKAALGEVSLQMGISRTKAGTWLALGEALQQFPKILAAYLEGDHSTHRVQKLVRAAQIAPDADITEDMVGEQAPSGDGGGDVDHGAGDGSDGLELTLDDLVVDGEGRPGAESDSSDPAAEDQSAADADGSGDESGPSDREADIDFEDLALELASRPITDTDLVDALNGLVISLDPDRAAEVREEFAEEWQNVVITADAAGHAVIEARAPAEHGVHLGNRLSSMVSERVCPADPRTVGQRRVIALAELIGIPEARLSCSCGRRNCRAAANREEEPRREAETGARTGDSRAGKPRASAADTGAGREGGGGGGDGAHAGVVADPDAGAGVGAGRVSGAGAGVGVGVGVDSGVGDRGASGAAAGTADGAAVGRGVATGVPECAQSEASVDGRLEAEAIAGQSVAASSSAIERSELVQPTPLTIIVDPTGASPPRLRGYGSIDPAKAAELAEHATILSPRQPRVASSGLIITDRGAPPVDPAGHGGFAQPPPGALTYAPSAGLRGDVECSDRTCRYPLCTKPSHLCQLDHLVPFNHADPLAGGWTVLDNLIPLCLPDHQRKHFGLWIPTMRIDRTIVWRDPRTGYELTTYPR
ncbi:HNH endonuclease signature motif containing protein [Gordonia sp. ABSL11-1]|uniref:HNH endonuclease signature motif containing protein n=1 Tax=Gordonia sp. ABSL11-1 TaxID=3053924 RepID=UPI00257479BC|nr:HNH endonuclease signature motif containing protein [Gordonia sp. ABSL11-1]MDL9945372.1 HNH endonuclease signature motif containing protein [Gordonia sp. ABSL11-1]